MLEILKKDIVQEENPAIEYDPRGYYPSMTYLRGIKSSLFKEAMVLGINLSNYGYNLDKEKFKDIPIIPNVDYAFFEGIGKNKISYYESLKRETKNFRKRDDAYYDKIEIRDECNMYPSLTKEEKRLKLIEFCKKEQASEEKEYNMVKLIEEIREKRLNNKD